MKYHDSMASAQDKMTKLCLFLEQHKLAPHPINYHVAYAYITADNIELNKEIDHAISHNQKLDDFIIENLYQSHLSQQQKSQEVLIQSVTQVVNKIETETTEGHQAINQYIANLDSSLLSLNENNLTQSRQVISTLIDASYKLKTSQLKLQDNLLQAQAETKKTKQKLLILKQTNHTDPLTGLFKQNYMLEQAQIWIEEQKSLCAINININDFSQFIQKYGHVISDVVLNKIANKVKSYVLESGLPVRTRNEEFLIILPDIELETVNEIAEKMRTGVEKLRFVSSRTGRRLPTITISMGIAEISPKESIIDLTRKVTSASSQAIESNQSVVIRYLD
ncbi:GGDEF domain-containing protein [Pseudoalteromonas denitrificans]|uniref:diguanylate cyclase n=1 Tax=Pseudoalteromonas denitrificans DSM 6059 TaxID=1123010 RepID=A0A1I1MDF1_9GAMM|nr:diguanylate cyclase [Pseudoalteromonas denitrificans]SFC83394.1 diguanylate cyclase [Pseudoalteromonas denitrificans DSM 6059]